MWTDWGPGMSKTEKSRVCKATQEEKGLAAMSDSPSLVPRMRMLIPEGCPLNSLTQKNK